MCIRDRLADAVGLEITVDETESSVGDFNVDIYATETGTDRKIIIENQLEDTNHDHLGKLITYASGKSADIVIWVVKRANIIQLRTIYKINNSFVTVNQDINSFGWRFLFCN